MTTPGIRSAVRKPPETMVQAQIFDIARNFYSRAGLCNRCAAQAAYGHQNGFANVHPPCADCLPLVDAFPVPATGRWRRHVRPGRGNHAGRGYRFCGCASGK